MGVRNDALYAKVHQPDFPESANHAHNGGVPTASAPQENLIVVLNLDLSDEELAQLKSLTRVGDDANAVARAAREYLRLRRLRELKAASGRVDFELDWEELEELELRELDSPES